MPKKVYEHAITIQADPQRILSSLSRYEFFLENDIHPNLVKSDLLDERTGDDGVTRRTYRNFERVKFGPLTITAQHRAENYIDAEGALVGEAFQSPGVHLTVITRCTPQENGTLVEESVIAEASAALIGTVFSQAKHAHEEKLVKLKAVLEAKPADEPMA